MSLFADSMILYIETTLMFHMKSLELINSWKFQVKESTHKPVSVLHMHIEVPFLRYTGYMKLIKSAM